MTQKEKNKKTACMAYQKIFGDLDASAVDEYMSIDFVQQNPTIANGPNGVKALIAMLISQGVPKQKIEFGHVIADGDTGCLHSR